MSSAIDQATRSTTLAGASSRSSCERPRGFRPSASFPRPVITPPATEFSRGFLPSLRYLSVLICAAAILASAAFAQIPIPNSVPPPPSQDPDAGKQGPSIKVDVNLVVLHTTVIDDRQRFADGLKPENFRVFEDKVEQKLSVFKREDVPVSMGLVIDNSGSMRDKRPRVNEAAITLVQASNPQDEAFVVNFNDDFYLDLDKDFTSSIPELKEALERIDSRGSTALRDAILGSLDHLKKASKDKKVLLVVTDGEDNASRNSLEKMIREVQKTDTVIYTIGLLGQENKKEAKRARKALEQIAAASGGLAFFPENVDDVHNICEHVAHDIRNQYILAYYPTNTRRDGTFRAIQVEVIPPHGRGKLVARTRNGYYAPGAASSASGN
ncbi:MAG: VWA domain-containing protein [Acidobacteria bacterium]|nr:MAG: VWA domain-containing protein [Acidobacteriota bacterium]PYU39966.1 MAG: VWA domain-containing protein [Acidobacteriota bacterium]PYU62914.1 MAG: VWA domain-containing protein [Acidobacteriota bacterium]PYU74392.1 MAG: VWA domain-containing protein [Acidobacteriota bacterium]